jgi:ankyrin repeat protein
MDAEAVNKVNDTNPEPTYYYPPRSARASFNITRELHVACLLDDVDRVTELLSMGADHDAVSHAGYTALDVADLLNRVNVTKRLLAHVNIQENGMLELMYAIRQGKSTVVRALLEMGLNDQLRDEALFRGVFLMACYIGTTFVVNALVKYGPGLFISPFEDMFVQVALFLNNTEVADTIRDIADTERRNMLKDVEVCDLTGIYENLAF